MTRTTGPYVNQGPGSYDLSTHILYRYRPQDFSYPRIDAERNVFTILTYDPESRPSLESALRFPTFLHPSYLYLAAVPRTFEIAPFWRTAPRQDDETKLWRAFPQDLLSRAMGPSIALGRSFTLMISEIADVPLLARLGPAPNLEPYRDILVEWVPTKQEAEDRRDRAFIIAHQLLFWARFVRILIAYHRPTEQGRYTRAVRSCIPPDYLYFQLLPSDAPNFQDLVGVVFSDNSPIDLVNMLIGNRFVCWDLLPWKRSEDCQASRGVSRQYQGSKGVVLVNPPPGKKDVILKSSNVVIHPSVDDSDKELTPKSLNFAPWMLWDPTTKLAKPKFLKT